MPDPPVPSASLEQRLRELAELERAHGGAWIGQLASDAAKALASQRLALENLMAWHATDTWTWQPMDTAPEGAMVLWCSMTTGDVGKWCFVDWRAGGKFMLHPKWDATHWMPLPDPPVLAALAASPGR